MKPVSLTEQLMFTTVRLVTEDGGCGTGYFYHFAFNEYVIPVIITNKHVVNNHTREIVTFFVHLEEEENNPASNFSIKMEAEWFFHPTQDLCFCYVNSIFEKIQELTGRKVFYRSLDSSIIQSNEQLQNLSMMESVVMVGYPNGLWDQVNNFPVFRYGYTSSHPGMIFNEQGIGLVDIASFPGSSGSPVLIVNEGMYFEKTGTVHAAQSRIIFLGTLFAGPQLTVEGTIEIKDIPTRQEPVAVSKMMMNLGYYIKANEIYHFEPIIIAHLKQQGIQL